MLLLAGTVMNRASVAKVLLALIRHDWVINHGIIIVRVSREKGEMARPDEGIAVDGGIQGL